MTTTFSFGRLQEERLNQNVMRTKITTQPREREAYEVVVKDGKFIYKLSSVLLHTSEHSSFLAGGATSAVGRLVAEMRFLRIQEKSTGRCGREIVRRRWRSVRSGVREGMAQQGASPPLRLSLGCKPRIAVVICLIGRSCGEHRELSQPRQGTGEQRTVRDGSPRLVQARILNPSVSYILFRESQRTADVVHTQRITEDPKPSP
ncbi:hypothetical protein BHM03_00057381 [Ensete ventricosum]|nr:hypothetical protein BHM03_00057381 [Ensete ventricosum]